LPQHRAVASPRAAGTALERSDDPDELVGNGISKVITGDGFLMVAVFLSVTHTPMSSVLWLLLLLPAFYLFGRGFSDVFQARQIRRGRQREQIELTARRAELGPAPVLVADLVTNATTGKLVAERGKRSER
jgi:hypothetical protein